MDFPNTKLNNIKFSLQQGDDIVDHDQPFLISFQQEDHKPDLHEHVSMVDERGKSSINTSVSRNRKSAGNRASNNNPNAGGGGDGKDDDQTQKKMVHREIERQRRQQMTKLYATLRDLLPLKLVKGNRSISDHMHQAVHYIKQMEENIKDLSMKRDRHKKFPDPSNESSMNYLPNTVSVQFCDGGIEILINSCSIQDGFALSGVLKALVVEGFSVTSCTLTEVNNRLLHSIQSEASDLALVDLSMLQQRLFSVANTETNFE